MIKRILLFVFCLLGMLSSAYSQATGLSDLKFGRYQIADSQWNVSACMYTSTCQIYSTSPGTAYKIPWTSGQLSWVTGDYVAFSQTGDATNPWNAVQYNSSGQQKAVMGTGHIINMGTDFFFFVGNDNNTGQLFSMTSGLSSTAGMTWTGTLNPTVAQVNSLATNGSTTPLAAGQTVAPSGPVPTKIYMNSSGVYVTRTIPTSNNSPAGEGPNNAFDNNPNTKYLNFDKKNAGVTVQLNSGRVVSGFTLTTANDFSGRDPTSYKLYGSNDGVNWTPIQEGPVSLSESRFWTSPTITVTNTTAYVYYYIYFPTTKSGDGCGLNCDSMQIAEITYIYDANSTVTSTATGTNVTNPSSLCCGASASAFNANATNVSKVNAFANRTTQDSKVNVEQIGNQNSISISQEGTRNNYVNYTGNGTSNNINITQSGNASTVVNYVDLSVIGNMNYVNITQQSTGGSKGVFANVQDNNNSLIIQQRDSGNHYAEVSLSGGNKNVDILQQGSAGHMASVILSGQPTSLNLQQSGTGQNFYSIQFNCSTAGGCGTISVNQTK